MFDVVLDRAAMPCNYTENILKALRLIYKKIRPNGLLIGIDWYTKNHSCSHKGQKIDRYTRANILSGVFANQGVTHFFTKKHLYKILTNSGFKLKILERKESKYLIGRKKLIF